MGWPASRRAWHRLAPSRSSWAILVAVLCELGPPAPQSPPLASPGFPWLPLAGLCPTPRKLSEDRQAKLAGGLARFFEQLDISHGSPRDERSPGVVFFGAFFFDCFYGDSTGVVVDQPSVKAAPAPEPHGYSLSVPVLRQIPGQRASPVRLRSPGILPLPGAFAPVLDH
jgi:hypothetical protein